MSEEILQELSERRISRAHDLIQSLPFLSRSAFTELLVRRFYSSAILYSSLDRSPQLLLRTSLCDFRLLCLRPTSVDFGLFFLAALRIDNRDERSDRDIVSICEEVLDRKVVVYALQPVAVAAVVISVLTSIDKSVKGKTQKRWERFIIEYDRRAYKRFRESYVRSFEFRMLTGKTLAKTIMESHNQTLISLKGLRSDVKLAWNGPYSLSFCPTSSLAAHFFQPRKRGQVHFWSFRSFYTSPKCRFYYQLFALLITICGIHIAIQMKYSTAKLHMQRLNSNHENTPLETDSNDYVFLLATTFVVTDFCYEMNKVTYYLLKTGSAQVLGMLQLISVAMLASASIFIYSDSLFGFEHGTRQMFTLGTSLAFFIFVMSFKVLINLRVVSFFAHLTNSLFVMFQKSLAFALIMLLLLYAYASQYQMFNLVNNRWGEDIGKSLYYGFIIMLGNLPLEMSLINRNPVSTISLVIFVIATTIIMLNLLVTVLSEVYYDSLASVKRTKTELIWWYTETMKTDQKFAWLTCVMPPFSALSFLLSPVILCFPRLQRQASSTLVKFGYCCTLFPLGVICKLLLDLVLVLPCFLRGFRNSRRFFRAGQVADSDSVYVESAVSSWKEFAQWAICGMPLLLKSIFIETVEFSVSLLELPSTFTVRLYPKRILTNTELQINHATDCSINAEDPKGEDNPEEIARNHLGFEGESELLEDIREEFDHFASPWLSNKRYVKQMKKLLENFRPEIVYSALVKRKNRKVFKQF